MQSVSNLLHQSSTCITSNITARKELVRIMLVQKKPRPLTEEEKSKKSIRSIEMKIKLIISLLVLTAIGVIIFVKTRTPKPTALSLIQGINKDFTYSDVNLNIDFSVTDENADVEMITNVAVISDTQKSDSPIQHLSGDLSTSVFGITGNVDVDMWKDGLKSYTLDKSKNTWVSSFNESGILDVDTVIKSIDLDIFESFKLEKYTKQDTELAITGTLSNKKFFELLRNMVTTDSSIMSYDLDSTDKLFQDATYNFMLVFDKDSRELKYIQFSLEDDSDNVFKFIIQINELGTKTLELPNMGIIMPATSTDATTSTDADQSTETDDEDEPKIISNLHTDKTFVTPEDLESITNGDIRATDSIVSSIQTLVNEYTEDEFMLLASTWGKLSTELKQSIVFIYKHGWVDAARFESLGIGEDEIALYY